MHFNDLLYAILTLNFMLHRLHGLLQPPRSAPETPKQTETVGSDYVPVF